MFTEAEEIKIVSVKSTIKMETESFLYQLGSFYSKGVLEDTLKNIFISGGCIASLLQGEKVNDYDLYFKTETVMNDIRMIYTKTSLKDQIEDVSENYREALGTDGKLITENAITLKNGVQLITKHFGHPDKLRKTFDYVHCMPYYDFAEDKLYISRVQYDAIINKKLIWNMSETDNGFPDIVGNFRELKFKKRGYTW